MNKKTVIGLNTKYIMLAIFASIVGLISVFLPYVTIQDESLSLFTLFTKVVESDIIVAYKVIVGVATIGAILTAVMALVNLVKLSVGGVRIWVIFAALWTAALTVLLIANKAIIDGTGAFSETFLVKNLSSGYWVGLVVAYFVLAIVMKTAKINAGYIVLVILSIIWLFPIAWIVLTSLRAEQGFYVGYFIPKGFTLDNYLNLFGNESVIPFGKWWMNTFIVAISGCIINTLIILGTSFVLSRTRFAGRTTFMKILMIIGMFPGFMSMIAVYNILKGIGLNQSLVALIVVGAAGAAMGYHVCKGFFDTIPKALDEAAIIDGATRMQIFTKISIPLSKPIIIYTVLCNFLGAWSDYIFPSMLMGDKQASYTVAIGLKWLTDFRRINSYYTQFAAGAVMVAVPIVILFIWLQRFYIEGLSGSVKG